jgi:alpha-L-rhamnosidase
MYQVRIGTTPATLGDVFDSGKVDSTASQNVAGPTLAPSTRFYWAVRTWDAHGEASPYSATAQFGTRATWTATPIWWSPAATLGSDYDVEGDFKVTTVAAGIKFRVNGSNSFMWQIRGDSSNELRPHVQVNGTYTQLKAVKLPMTIGLNTFHHVRINAVGSTIRTYIDGVLVDTTVDARNPAGAIGFRHGQTESAVWDDVKVTSTSGETLYRNDFDAPSKDFPCGTVANGVLTVGTGKDCANAPGDNWAFLRKTFTLPDKPILNATLYASARSTEPAHQYVFRLGLNGRFVGVGPTRAIRDATTSMYNAYDVTDLLKAGENAIGALAYTTADKRFIAQLKITYADGSKDVVASDGSWKALGGETAMPPGASIGTSAYAAPAENIDARRYPFGYDTPGFDDRGWDAATTKAAMPGLTGTPQANLVRVLRRPVNVVKTGDKHYFLDFGRTVVGGLQLRFDAAGGEQAEIRLGETQADNVARYQMTTGNTYRDTWTLKPGEQTLSLWGYRVFRYAEVIGADPADIQAASLVYPYDANASSCTRTATGPRAGTRCSGSRSTRPGRPSGASPASSPRTSTGRRRATSTRSARSGRT